MAAAEKVKVEVVFFRVYAVCGDVSRLVISTRNMSRAIEMMDYVEDHGLEVKLEIVVI